MSIGGRIFATMYDRQMAKVESAGLAAQRASLLAGARGHVIEIGGGTGASLPYYGPAVESVMITEPETPMIKRLQRRVRDHTPTVKVLRAPAEDLPFDDHSFDTAVSTLVLCTVSDQPRALRELRRVLRPGGRLLFIEHVRADELRLASWQNRLNGLNRIVGHGCNCNRPTLDSLRAAGLTVTDVEHSELKRVPPFLRPLVIGSATAAEQAREHTGTAVTHRA
jgi:ubiquinone/menaquinone biosynthesis C-methylase UbiE